MKHHYIFEISYFDNLRSKTFKATDAAYCTEDQAIKYANGRFEHYLAFGYLNIKVVILKAGALKHIATIKEA